MLSKLALIIERLFPQLLERKPSELLLQSRVCNKWKVFYLDKKSAFKDGVLKEEVCGQQLERVIVKENEDKVYKLHNALYGLKQTPRAW